MRIPYINIPEEIVGTVKNDLEIIGKAAIENQPPFGRRSQLNRVRQFFMIDNYGNKKIINKIELNSDASFGTFIIFAANLESYEDNTYQSKTNLKVVENNSELSKKYYWIINGHYGNIVPEKISKELEACNFNTNQREFIWNWIYKKIRLVTHKAK